MEFILKILLFYINDNVTPNKRISCDFSKLMNGTQPWIEHNSVVAALLVIEHHLDPV